MKTQSCFLDVELLYYLVIYFLLLSSRVDFEILFSVLCYFNVCMCVCVCVCVPYFEVSIQGVACLFFRVFLYSP